VCIIIVLGMLLFIFIACSALTIASCSTWLFEHLSWSLYFTWCVNSFCTKVAAPDPTQFSLLLPSVNTWIVCSCSSLYSLILTVSAGWVQSFGSTSWSSWWFCLSLLMLRPHRA
jgi:hypothetical protein